MIEVQNISKNYNGVQALNDISFSVQEGELFGFIGPDGAGKTTLFRLITSLLLPDTGSASVFEYDVIKHYRQIRAITGYMPGKFSLYSDLSVLENLEFFATVFGTTIEQNYDLIKDIYRQIEPFKHRLAGKLSGGMKQKLALSCALIHKPQLLVLDEPTTGVDAVSRREFWEMLQKLKEKKITILVSTPYMDEAILCDRVALMQNGGIMAIDTPEGIISSYHKQIYSISSDHNFQLLSDLRNYQNTLRAFAFGSDIHYTDKGEAANISMLQRYLKSAGHNGVEIKAVSAEIEDVFIDLMTTNTQGNGS